MKRYPGTMLLDSTGVGDPIFDALRREKLPVKSYKFSAESKRKLVTTLGCASTRIRYRSRRSFLHRMGS